MTPATRVQGSSPATKTYSPQPLDDGRRPALPILSQLLRLERARNDASRGEFTSSPSTERFRLGNGSPALAGLCKVGDRGSVARWPNGGVARPRSSRVSVLSVRASARYETVPQMTNAWIQPAAAIEFSPWAIHAVWLLSTPL